MSTQRQFVEESDLLKKLHGPFFPSEVRKGDQVKARVDFVDETKSIDLQVWRLSPLGVELIWDQAGDFPRGKKVSVSITVGNQVSVINGLVVDLVEESQGLKILGIRLVASEPEVVHFKEKRKSKRWLTTDQFLPTGMAPNPAKYNDFIFFRIKDISADGMQVITSLRNKFILQGMVFDSSVSFPMGSQVRVKFVVKNIRIYSDGQSEFLSLGLEFVQKTVDLMDNIGQYLAQFTNVESIDSLHDEGLSPSSLQNAIQFSYVKSEDDYMQVLKLRHLSYVAEGKIKSETPVLDMGDIYDTRSRIIIGKINGNVVATGRLTFNEHDQEFEQEKYVKEKGLFPRREQAVEIMRACTHPDYRGSDIFIAMFKFMTMAVAQSKRGWVIINTTEKHLPIYLKLGAKLANISYEIPAFNNKKHHVLIGDVQKCLLGKGMNPLFWNYVYGDLIDYLDVDEIYKISLIDKIRLLIYRSLAPLSEALAFLVINPKRIERARLRDVEKGA